MKTLDYGDVACRWIIDMGVGYPSLWPSAICKEPLDILARFSSSSLSIWEVMKSTQLETESSSSCREESFNNFGDKLDHNTVVHNWLGGTVAEEAVAAGLRCILSKQESWYLDHLYVQWEGFYMNEPLAKIHKPEQQRLVLGGEVCMWGEKIDSSDIQQTIWPRSAAAAERLWTPIEKLATNTSMAAPRLAWFRCLLNQRGVAAAPLVGYGQSAPLYPGSCISQ
ncbi:beta-hexosaminidase 3-like [Panicum miliaceum]|uniref:beta-N-acetylhexosaminidase n=1 Tax=Panicum miliaceum TaxID=4540 RepID=A0A3L6T081_PANMI|nr:beta-hexosaminidase 3-like [Panicum miliaceum]